MIIEIFALVGFMLLADVALFCVILHLHCTYHGLKSWVHSRRRAICMWVPFGAAYIWFSNRPSQDETPEEL